jgi:hypothetical protein
MHRRPLGLHQRLRGICSFGKLLPIRALAATLGGRCADGGSRVEGAFILPRSY